MRLAVLLTLLAACALPHRDSELRQVPARAATVVAVHISCADSNPIDDVTWATRDATGVIVGGDHVLTAAHATFCPTIAGVTLELVSGRHRRAFVTREAGDVALVELAARPAFDVAPPFVDEVHGDERACIETLRGAACGTADPYDPELIRGVSLRLGDSGAPAYVAGELVGTVSTTGDGWARIVGVPEGWAR